jgi:hypothetical protein
MRQRFVIERAACLIFQAAPAQIRAWDPPGNQYIRIPFRHSAGSPGMAGSGGFSSWMYHLQA